MSFKIDCKHRHTFVNSASTNEKANSFGLQSTSILSEVNLLYTFEVNLFYSFEDE